MDGDKSMAQLAYEAYADSVGWKSFSGDALLQWGELPSAIHNGWHAAVNAIQRAQYGPADS